MTNPAGARIRPPSLTGLLRSPLVFADEAAEDGPTLDPLLGRPAAGGSDHGREAVPAGARRGDLGLTSGGQRSREEARTALGLCLRVRDTLRQPFRIIHYPELLRGRDTAGAGAESPRKGT